MYYNAVYTMKKVFNNWAYVLTALVIGVLFWLIFATLEELIFFSPRLVFWLPSDAVLNFIISTVTAVILGLTVSMSIYGSRHTIERSTHNNSGSSNQPIEPKDRISCSTSYRSSSSSSSSPWILSTLSFAGIISGACINCSLPAIPLMIVNIFGASVGMVAIAFLSYYQIPIQLATLGLLVLSFILTLRKINIFYQSTNVSSHNSSPVSSSNTTTSFADTGTGNK
jgi:hypothetical protein